MADKGYQTDVDYLSTLPMETLLRMKKQLEEITPRDQLPVQSESNTLYFNPIYETDTDEGQVFDPSYGGDSGFRPMKINGFASSLEKFFKPSGYSHKITPQPYTLDDLK